MLRINFFLPRGILGLGDFEELDLEDLLESWLEEAFLEEWLPLEGLLDLGDLD
jgi:hypothetical protein